MYECTAIFVSILQYVSLDYRICEYTRVYICVLQYMCVYYSM